MLIGAGLVATVVSALPASPAQSRLTAAAAPTVRQMVGQTLMGAMHGTTPSPQPLERIREGELGGIIIFGGNVTTPAALKAVVESLQAAAAAGGNPPLLIATDQEGGDVKRFPDGPPDASAEAMGATFSAAAVRQQGWATGGYLRPLGINVDLAPVLDVGDSPTSFLGDRIFSAAPAKTALLGTAFASGVQSAHIAATAKHFPGLGTAPGNTDSEVVVVPSSSSVLLEAAGAVQRCREARDPARDGLECRISVARPVSHTGGALEADRHRPAPPEVSSSRAW